MDRKRESYSAVNRRDFLKRISAGAAILTAARVIKAPPANAASKLPVVMFGPHQISRLIAGYNPIGGHSHLNRQLSDAMREWFTVERTVEFLLHCEELGVNTFQFDITEKTEQALEIVYGRGSKLKFICLHAERPKDCSLKHLMKYKPIAIAHHGGVTDSLFRADERKKVHDYVKKVKDQGVLAGVSSHNPANIAQIEEEGWENDFYMTCFYNVARTREEMEKELGFVSVGEPFIESDADKMTAVIRKLNKPCLAFKILAAGRKCDNESAVANAFRYAFENIKSTDSVIVGMFPRDTDQVRQNVDYTLKYGVSG